MIWLCGDTHGDVDFYKVKDFFEGLIICGEKVTKEDYLIILGDVAVCWDGGSSDDYVQELLQNLPCTVLWLDGNHENFDVIEQYPVSEWNGGKVQYITDDIIHLMRGQVFEIEGKSFFVFGGGNSIDKIYRQRGISWWPEEMPSYGEYEEGLSNLERVGNRVDYILSHTCPGYVAQELTTDLIPGEEELQQYFDDISQNVDYDMWYFAHWHMDQTEDKCRCLWNDIVEIE